MFKTIAATFKKDNDLPDRAALMALRHSLLDGTFYDNLPNEFHVEKNDAGDYVPLAQRAPSVRSGLLRTVVDDSVSLLFSEGHFPDLAPAKEDLAQRDKLQQLAIDTRLNEVMIEAATIGAVGSVAIFMRVLKGKRGYRVFYEPKPTTFLTPIWDENEPDLLKKIREEYKTKGRTLRDAGYAVADDELGSDFWFAREWNDTAETWFVPVKIESNSGRPIVIDRNRTVRHALGFLPATWVKNLPPFGPVDGASTMTREAIETVIQIDYLMSQGGRALRYASDPLLMIKEPSGRDGPIMRSASNALLVDPTGDAKLLEIDGSASDAVINYARALRELALESMKGNRINTDKLSGAQSGRAMEMMNQALIWLADRLRITYGEGALRSLILMAVLASEKYPLVIGDETAVTITLQKPLALKWPRWYAPTADDRLSNANTVRAHVDSHTMSRKTAVQAIADDYDVEDVDQELKDIETDITTALDLAATQVKVIENE